jgi:hypothetical protein
MVVETTVNDAPSSATQDIRWRWFPWVGLALLILIQYGLFRQCVEREVAGFYPPNSDQLVYLCRSYEAYQDISVHGPFHAFRDLFLGPSGGSGVMIEPEATLLYLVLGPSRLTALTVNFISFALFETVLLLSLVQLTGRWSMGFLGIGLLLTSATPFFFAGGLMDFRIDLPAWCLYGILICVVLRSGVFLSRRWSVAAGLVATWLVWTRHLTALYLGGTGGCLLLILLVLTLVRDPERQARIRTWNLALTGLILAVLSAPIIYVVWPSLYNHYIAHLTSGEGKVRLAEFNSGETWASRFSYYVHSLMEHHLGGRFLCTAGAILVVALLSRLAWFAVSRTRSSIGTREQGFALLYVALSLMIPVTALSVYASPSPVVGSILVGPILLLTLLVSAALFPRDNLADRWIALLATLVVSVGLYTFTSFITRPVVPDAVKAQQRQVTRLYKRISELSRQAGLEHPSLYYTYIGDSFFHLVLQIEDFERRGFLSHPVPSMSGIMEVPEGIVLTTVRKSDFVVVERGARCPTVYPFILQMRRMNPSILAACKEQHVLIDTFDLPSGEFELYTRVPATVSRTAPDQGVAAK